MSKPNERRRRVVRATAPAFGLLAAGLLVWQGSYAAFSATTQDNSNTWSTATLALQNDGGVAGGYAATTTATFGGNNIKPGDTGTTCLTVKSTGSVAGALHMYESSLVDASALGAQLNLVVSGGVTPTEVTSGCASFPAAATTLYTGTLAAVPTTYATSAGTNVAVAAGPVLVAYKVTWTFNAAATNAFQGTTATAGFTWELQ
jgi:hypothetical protein